MGFLGLGKAYNGSKPPVVVMGSFTYTVENGNLVYADAMGDFGGKVIKD